MGRFVLRHWTGLLIVVLAFVWGVFYLPQTPTFAILQLKMAIDARDGDRAAQFIDFQSVVRKAANEVVEKKGADDPFGTLIAKGAVQLFSAPAAGMAEAWAKRKVEDGAREVQMPGGAVAGALVLLHRNGDTAYTRFRDPKGRLWDIEMARKPDGQWQVVEIKNIQQLIDELEKRERSQFGTGAAP